MIRRPKELSECKLLHMAVHIYVFVWSYIFGEFEKGSGKEWGSFQVTRMRSFVVHHHRKSVSE